MVKRIIWTEKANQIFSDILDFYIRRNGSKTYSRKLNDEIRDIILLLQKHPFLGKEVDFENISVLIKGNFKIFY